MSRGTRAAATWMVFGAFHSALMGALIRWIRDDVPWQIVVFSRTTIGLLFALLLLRASGASFPFRGPRELWMRSVAAGLAILCTFYAAAKIPIADAVVLVNTAPIWLTLLSVVVLRQRLRPSTYVALLVGTAGLVIMSQPHFASRNLGALAGLTTGVLAAISLLSITRMRHIPPAAIVAHTHVALVASSGIVLASSHGSLSYAFLDSPRTLAVLVAIGALGTVVQFAYTRAFTTGQAARVAPLQYSAAAFAVGFDTFLFFDPPAADKLLGIGLVVATTVWVVMHPREAMPVRHSEVSAAPAVLPDQLHGLVAYIQRAERLSSCEARIHVERTCRDRMARPREIFDQLGVARTKLHNGVLVYFAVDSKLLAIVFDEGITDLVPAHVLDELSTRASTLFAERQSIDGVGEALVEMFRTLGGWFPYQTTDVNELDDTISIAW